MTQNITGTTIVGVRIGTSVAMSGDGQVTMGQTVMKHHANKLRTLAGDQVLAGFAGSTADAFTLFERFEEKLEKYTKNLTRAAVELAKDWRSDRVLRRLEALLAVMDEKTSLIISGTGDVVEPDDEVIAIGSGGPFALAAARAFVQAGEKDAAKVSADAIRIAADICLYTNAHINTKILK